MNLPQVIHLSLNSENVHIYNCKSIPQIAANIRNRKKWLDKLLVCTTKQLVNSDMIHIMILQNEQSETGRQQNA